MSREYYSGANFLYSPQFIHQSLGANVSVNVAQVIAGFSKVFVGEIIELGTSSLPRPPGPHPILDSNLYSILE